MNTSTLHGGNEPTPETAPPQDTERTYTRAEIEAILLGSLSTRDYLAEEEVAIMNRWRDKEADPVKKLIRLVNTVSTAKSFDPALMGQVKAAQDQIRHDITVLQTRIDTERRRNAI